MEKELNHPLYFYAMQKFTEGSKRLIYHYTSAGNFFCILNSMSLKLSDFSNSDDLNEANIANVDRISNVMTMNSLEKFIKSRCSYLSFVRGGDFEFGELEGTNHPRMWSQYANKGFGVCLAIDEDRFFDINKKSLSSNFYKFENVQYENKNGASVMIDVPYIEGNDESLIKRYYRELFFKKHLDWKGENEKRLFGIDLPKYLSIYEALEFICLGPNFMKDDTSMTKLLDYITNPSLKYKDYLVPQSFASITPYDYGYFADDSFAVSEIERRLNMRKR